jgi:hypothetical protein
MTNSTPQPASSSNEHLTVLSQPWDTPRGRQILTEAEPGHFTLTPKGMKS